MSRLRHYLLFLSLITLTNFSTLATNPAQSDAVSDEQALYNSLFNESDSGKYHPNCNGDSSLCCLTKTKVKYFQGLQFLMKPTGGDKSLIELQKEHDAIMAKLILFDGLSKLSNEFKSSVEKLQALQDEKLSFATKANAVKLAIPKMENMIMMDEILKEALGDDENNITAAMRALKADSAKYNDNNEFAAELSNHLQCEQNSSLAICGLLSDPNKKGKMSEVLRGFFNAHETVLAGGEHNEQQLLDSYIRKLNENISDDFFEPQQKRDLLARVRNVADIQAEFDEIDDTIASTVALNLNELEGGVRAKIELCLTKTSEAERRECYSTYNKEAASRGITVIKRYQDALTSFNLSFSKNVFKSNSGSRRYDVGDLFLNTNQRLRSNTLSNLFSKADDYFLAENKNLSPDEIADSFAKYMKQESSQLEKRNYLNYGNVPDSVNQTTAQKITSFFNGDASEGCSEDLNESLVENFDSFRTQFCAQENTGLNQATTCGSTPLASVGTDKCMQFNGEILKDLMTCINSNKCNQSQIEVGGKTKQALLDDLNIIKSKINSIKASAKYSYLDSLKHYVAADVKNLCGQSGNEIRNLSVCSERDNGMADVELFLRNGNEILGEIDSSKADSLAYRYANVDGKRAISARMKPICDSATNTPYLQNSIVRNLCSEIAQNQQTDRQETNYERYERTEREYYRRDDGTLEERMSAADIWGGAIRSNASGIAQAAMAALFPPTDYYNMLGAQAMAMKDWQFRMNEMFNPNPQFYNAMGGIDCSTYFCAQSSPYFDFTLNASTSNPLAGYNTQGFGW